ncbi:MAG: phage integrase N-terminal SAM-like domain-containing protein [Chloroflexi bacterium]|nr:phage integrase N-terminal SAM-like domain-containing protein [Chloroflexota bacterium]
MYQAETPERVLSLIGGGLSDRFAVHLAAQGKARVTIRVYRNAVHLFQVFLADQGLPQEVANIQLEHVEAFIASVEETRRPGTAYSRYWGLRQFFEWQVEEDAIPISPMAGMSQPHKPGKSRRVRTEKCCGGMDSVEVQSKHISVGAIRGVGTS